jgi:hypothetical protein
VFVSYATEDAERFQIARLAETLTRCSGIDDVLYWEADARDDIYQYMNENVGRCDVFLMFCSPNALHSEAVELEWMAALKKKKRIIPIFHREADIPTLLTTKLGVRYKAGDFEGTLRDIHQLILKKTQTHPARSMMAFLNEYLSSTSVACAHCGAYLSKIDVITRRCPECGGLVRGDPAI